MSGSTLRIAAASTVALALIACDAGSFVEPQVDQGGGGTQVAARVVMDSTPSMVTEDDSIDYSVTVVDSEGDPIRDAEVQWATTDENIVRVEPTGPSNGTLIANRPGTATITASYESLSASVTIEVHKRPVDLIYVSGSGQQGPAGTQLKDSLAVRVIDKRGDPVSLVQVGFSVESGGGTVSPEAGTTDAGGWMRAAWTLGSGGEQVVEAHISAGQPRIRNVKDSVVVFTAHVVDPTSAEVGSVAITPDSVALVTHDVVALKAEVKDNNGNSLNAPSVTWASTNPDVAAVDSEGVVTARGAGGAKITAASGNVVDSANVEVATLPISSVVVSPAVDTLEPGNSVQLGVTVRRSDGTEVANPAVTWASSDPSVAVVSDQGLVTAVTEGEILVSASVQGVEGSATIVVSSAAQGSLTILPPDTLYGPGDTLTLTVEARAADGSLIPNPGIQWNSRDPDIATVDSMGTVTARALGVAVIAASAACCAGDFVDVAVVEGLGLINDLTAVPGNGQATIYWTPAANATEQQPEYSADQGTNWVSYGTPLSGGAGSATVLGLTNGTTYRFRVVASDGATNTVSNTATATPADGSQASSGRNAILDAAYPTPVAPAPLRTFYLDASGGNDSGAGTSSNPWRTFDKLLATAQPGDRFYLKGTFNDALGYGTVHASGTRANPIQVMAWPGSTAVIASNDSGTPSVFMWSDADYWWFEGLTIRRGANSSSEGFLTQAGSDGHTFVNNTIDGVYLHLVGSSDTRIYENSFVGTIGSEAGNSGDAVFTQNGSNNVEIVRNSITADVWHAAMTIGGYQNASEADCVDTKIIRNTIRNTAAGGINVNGKSLRAVIAGNDIMDTGTQNSSSVGSQDGIFLTGREAEVYWNRVWGGQAKALKIQGYTFWGFGQLAKDNHVYNNTFFHNAGGAVELMLENDLPGLTGNVIENNIFWKNNSNGGMSWSGSSYEIWANFYQTAGQTNTWTPTDAKGNIIRNNVMANTANADGGWLLIVRRAGDGDNISYRLSQAEANFANWTDNFEADPLFMDEVTPDLHLQGWSLAINAGRMIAGMPYLGSAPDMGAYEAE